MSFVGGRYPENKTKQLERSGCLFQEKILRGKEQGNVQFDPTGVRKDTGPVQSNGEAPLTATG